MSIPTKFKGELGEIDNAASGILTQLQTLQHAAPRDIPRMREALREKLQSYVDAVMATARTQ